MLIDPLTKRADDENSPEFTVPSGDFRPRRLQNRDCLLIGVGYAQLSFLFLALLSLVWQLTPL